MINKIKSAKVHLVKFLFVLPMLALMLLAFRKKMNTPKKQLYLTYAGIVVNADSYRKYGENEEAVELFTVPQSATDTVPPPPPPTTQPVGPIQNAGGKDSIPAPALPVSPPMPAPRPAAAPKPNIQSIVVNRQGIKPVVTVKSKNGSIKKYDFNKPGEQEAYEKEIGYPPVSPARPVAPVQPVKAISPQVSIKTSVNVDPIYVVDGVSVSTSDVHAIYPVTNVQVKALTEQKAGLSGDTASPAAVILTAKDHDGKDITALAERITINNFELFKGVIILNGKEITKEALQNIAGDSIRIVSVLKGSAAEELYKEKGKNGVIIITTKPTQ